MLFRCSITGYPIFSFFFSLDFVTLGWEPLYLTTHPGAVACHHALKSEQTSAARGNLHFVVLFSVFTYTVMSSHPLFRKCSLVFCKCI
jgi:hypothetical protein